MAASAGWRGRGPLMALRSYRQCMSASGTKPTWRIDPLMSAFKAKQTVALCSTQSSKRTSRNLRRVRIRDIQLSAAKVSNPKFRGKKWKFPRHFKGHFPSPPWMISEVGVAFVEVPIHCGSCLVHRLIVTVLNYGARPTAKIGSITLRN